MTCPTCRSGFRSLGPYGECIDDFHKEPMILDGQRYTKGPWMWDVAVRESSDGRTGPPHIRLVTPDRGRKIVMDFVRLGMGDAQPRFQRENPGIMQSAFVYCTPPDHNRNVDLVHPDAKLMAASPDLFELLRDALDSLEYVEKNHPGLSGYGVRQERIRNIKNMINALGIT